ncbi:uncharacterized protein [Symphalangus syndactylus]|uniref:uncharacterized protein n=1 Tax=Symphalangus syndactylus TaxID=9590 RepID=UPI0030067E4F
MALGWEGATRAPPRALRGRRLQMVPGLPREPAACGRGRLLSSFRGAAVPPLAPARRRHAPRRRPPRAPPAPPAPRRWGPRPGGTRASLELGEESGTVRADGHVRGEAGSGSDSAGPSRRRGCGADGPAPGQVLGARSAASARRTAGARLPPPGSRVGSSSPLWQLAPRAPFCSPTVCGRGTRGWLWWLELARGERRRFGLRGSGRVRRFCGRDADRAVRSAPHGTTQQGLLAGVFQLRGQSRDLPSTRLELYPIDPRTLHACVRCGFAPVLTCYMSSALPLSEQPQFERWRARGFQAWAEVATNQFSLKVKRADHWSLS